MPELGTQISEYIDDVAPAIVIEDVQRRLPLDGVSDSPTARGRRTRWLGAAAAVAFIAMLAGLAVVLRGPDAADRVEVGPATTAVDAGDWEWLAQFGTEVPAPVVPDGWNTLDFGEVRFAVPADWVVPISRSCAPAAPGIVLVSNGVEPQSSCSPIEPLPESVVTVEASTESEGAGGRAMVGTLPATRIEDSSCSGCPATYALDNGYQVTVTGPDAQRVLDTFTDSGSRRALQSGAEADTTGWRSIDYEGVSFLVPPTWETVDLPASYSEYHRPDGATEITGKMNPGSCGTAMFPNDQLPQVSLGTSPLMPSCPAWQHMNLAPGDGVWIRSTEDSAQSSDGGNSAALGTPIATGRANDLEISIVEVDRLASRTPSPVVDVLVRDGETVHWISLGVGGDASVARAILHSLRASG